MERLPMLLAPYSDQPICPRCTGIGRPVAYSRINRYVYDHNGRLISIAELGDPQDCPHLIVECERCGFQWLSGTADGA